MYGKAFPPSFFYVVVLFVLPIGAFAIHGFSGIKVTNEILANVNEVVEKNHLSSDHAIYDLVSSFKFFFRIQFVTTLIVSIPLLINNYSLFKLTRKEL
ncbi:hypothetical protein U8527_16100 [Kordia algicida OT-1]|uniref:Uncharacterized protein n=1 Tax=Kordia algicida OT-1 TaxID=391587 RepID=A9E4B6_9FLAO|nr:hypothetical protein [Kordia algicida]EDP95344.1 hypothetical protein KAOT1_09736 [Kordia algicida OT-1]